jgi:hypothetical protein
LPRAGAAMNIVVAATGRSARYGPWIASSLRSSQ